MWLLLLTVFIQNLGGIYFHPYRISLLTSFYNLISTIFCWGLYKGVIKKYKQSHTGSAYVVEIVTCHLYKTFNYGIPITEWNHLNQNIILTSRQIKFKTMKNNQLRIGMNQISNRFWPINDKIPLDWLNNSFETFKIKMKRMFISHWWRSQIKNHSTSWSNSIMIWIPL